MSTIKKVWTGTSPTHTFKDDVSGFGIFSAAQGLAPTGHTKVATISYRTFNTTTEAFGATQTVEFYSNSGSSSGNDWQASVSGSNLILNSSGSGQIEPLGNMPNVSTLTSINNVLNKLYLAGIIDRTSASKTSATYALKDNSPDINIYIYTKSSLSVGNYRMIEVVFPYTWNSDSGSITYASTAFNVQTPSAGTAIYPTDTITIYQANPNGGGNVNM